MQNYTIHAQQYVSFEEVLLKVFQANQNGLTDILDMVQNVKNIHFQLMWPWPLTDDLHFNFALIQGVPEKTELRLAIRKVQMVKKYYFAFL